jgi:hypothetical protein
MAYAAWALAIGILLSYEAFALKTKRMTLSRAVWTLVEAWPMTSALVGFITGLLFSHFFWIACGPCN